MTKTMLIDAMHAEETRVVVLKSGQTGPAQIEEFDFESHARKQLRGNIYLAKVTRVEPSLQAAFVEYGGNRHGFLAFNEIHPDYYQIPVADREKLMAELAQQAAQNSESHDDDEDDHDSDDGDDLPDEEKRLRAHLIRRYKIQEVIKRRQILLVQVVKEERGNKGAALTTYLSLAGRYCVLMPNTARGGGVSRKITLGADRKRLKTMINALDVPQGMGLIIRTAGAKRTRIEIKRDYDYLLRVWETIRETTLKSNAPALIYEEEDLVKRAIRDLFDKDVDQVLVAGEAGYRSARDFMRMIMPAHAKKIKPYQANAPLFVKFGVESHLGKIYSPTVALRSGGYLVINQTEALVAIDVNSGKSTKERNIEATALKTNLEAAEEAARQMRLRDLAGLVVIDFIDMDEPKNNRAVEKRLKDALDQDRARIQMGRISNFGLMEISRQRRRSGLLEGTTMPCAHCEGTGRIRSVDSQALSAMRAIDLEAMQNGAGVIQISLPQQVALYILNEKQSHLAHLRVEWGLKVLVEIDPDLAHSEFSINRTVTADEVDFTPPVRAEIAINALDLEDELIEDELDELDDQDNETPSSEDDDETSDTRRDKRKGRGRQRHRGDRSSSNDDETDDENEDETSFDESQTEDETEAQRNRRRRRGRRGGRRQGFETRPRETYAWLRARTPSLDAPYVWIDPFEELARSNEPQKFEARPTREEPAKTGIDKAPEGEDRSRRNRRDRSSRRSRGDRQRPDRQVFDANSEASEIAMNSGLGPVAEQAPISLTQASEDVTGASQLVTASPPETTKSRRPVRKRKSTSELQDNSTQDNRANNDEPKIEETPSEVVETVVKKANSRRSGAKKSLEPNIEIAVVSEPVSVSVYQSEADTDVKTKAPTEAPAVNDPAEIKAPPVQPKRGWWRR